MISLALSNIFIQRLADLVNRSHPESSKSTSSLEIKIGDNARFVNPDNTQLIRVSYAGWETNEMSILNGRFRIFFKDEQCSVNWIDPDHIMMVDSQRKQVLLIMK